jgi:hypothetical protein
MSSSKSNLSSSNKNVPHEKTNGESFISLKESISRQLDDNVPQEKTSGESFTSLEESISKQLGKGQVFFCFL